MRLLLQSLVVWALLALSAIGLGFFRVEWLLPRLGEVWAHVLGTINFVAALWIIVWLWLRLAAGPWPARALWGIGALWVAMTVSFEFGFGHYVAGHSWEKLLADYNLFAGRLWVLVLLSTFAAPRVCAGALGKLHR